jgi:hypothetical protein
MNLHPRAQVTQPTNQSYRIIPLTQSQVAFVDAQDYAALSKFKWHAEWQSSTFYAVRKIRRPDGKWRGLYMHRQILGASYDVEIDHKDHNGLNNRRENIRMATPSQNSQNAGARTGSVSGKKGVSLHSKTGLWRARINVDRREYSLGYFRTPEEAHAAYIAAAKEKHGEFAHW